MTLPLPLIAEDGAARLLARAWLALETAAPGPAERPPGLIVALPPAWGNRYQALLYGAAGRHRRAVVGVARPEDLRHVAWPGPVILHAHWFAGLFAECRDEAGAMARLGRIRAEIAAFRDRSGARLLWTAHNVFPHGNRFPRAFHALRQWIFESFDALHVMDAAHVPILEAAFGRKAPPHVVVPHMTYAGSLPDCIDRAAARAHHGLPPEAFVFGGFGAIRAYKGFERLLAACDRIAATGPVPVAAILGGQPGDAAAVRRLVLGWDGHPGVRLVLRQIPDHEIQYLHHAADAMVLPYDETLNSGAAFMAASFGKPVLMPRGPAAAALEGLGVIRFDPADPGALEAAMRAAIAGRRGRDDPATRERLRPGAVSAAFFAALDGLWPAG